MYELLFKYPPATFANGDFVLASGWPLGLLIGLLLAAAAGIGFHLHRHHHELGRGRLLVLGLLQAVFVGVLLAMLWQPAISVRQLRQQDNVVALLVDTSRSMSYGEEDQSRLQQAIAALDGGPLTRLRETFDLRIYGFARSAEPIADLATPPPPGEVTYLGTALESVLREARSVPLGAVIVVSDGADNAASADRAQPAELGRFGIPIHTIGVGPETMANDIELNDVTIADRGLPQTRVTATIAVQRSGAASTRLTVQDGDAVLASLPIELPAGAGVSNHTIEFDSGGAGLRDLGFSLDPIPGERNTINNTRVRLLEIPDETRRVLYLEGEPRWEYKFMRRANSGDAAVELVTLLQTTPNKFYRQGIKSADELRDGFPVDRETLFAFQALIIGSFESAALSAEQHQLIHDFVSERGGTLLMLGGPNGLTDGGWGDTVVGDALPARLRGLAKPTFVRRQVPVVLTPAGADAGLLQLLPDPAANRDQWSKLPAIADYQSLGELKPGAAALLNVEVDGSEQPVLAHQHYGRGSSYVLATGGTWRWQMGLPVEDQTHETFWRQLLRELATGAPGQLSLRADRKLYADETSVTIGAELHDAEYRPVTAAAISLNVAGETSPAFSVEMRPVVDQPGQYTASFEAPDPGVYRVDAIAQDGATPLGSASLHLRREDGVAEHFQLAQNRALLERIAAASGGRYWTLDNLAALPDAIRFSNAGLVERELFDLWDMPALFLLLLVLKATEWLLRLRWGRL